MHLLAYACLLSKEKNGWTADQTHVYRWSIDFDIRSRISSLFVFLVTKTCTMLVYQ
jgi:hypothetical protein